MELHTEATYFNCIAAVQSLLHMTMLLSILFDISSLAVIKLNTVFLQLYRNCIQNTQYYAMQK